MTQFRSTFPVWSSGIMTGVARSNPLCRNELKDAALARIAKIVHAADIAQDIDTDPLARGLEAIAVGYSLRYPDDEENLARQFEVYDALYAWCRLDVAKS